MDFIVIGGLSANLPGSAYVTLDLGICYSQASVNLKRLVAALAPFHPRPLGCPDTLPVIWDETLLWNATVLTLRTDLGEMDLLAEIAGLGSWDGVRNGSVDVEAFERTFSILDLRT